ncbi:MAG: four helix bundle protein [Gemmatimonadota bacterium]|nr:four helix bundle protein [Gemmatimonadota bacterium]
MWHLAGDLIGEVYSLAASLPPSERFTAALQLRRAAWSVQNNIAEGYARRGGAELRRFVDIALASLAEVDSMVATLGTMYQLDATAVDRIEALRRTITAAAFKLARKRPLRPRARARVQPPRLAPLEPAIAPSPPPPPSPPSNSQSHIK